MPYCPSCSYEYENDVRVCPDCSVTLAPGTGPEEVVPAPRPTPKLTPEMGELVPVANVPNRFVAILVKQQLEDAGIPVLIKTSVGADVGEWNRSDFVSQDIWAPEKLAVEARRMIYGPDIPRRGAAHWRNPDEELEHEFPLALDKYSVADDGHTTWLALDTPAAPNKSEADWRTLPTESEYLAYRRMRKNRTSTRQLAGQQEYSADEADEDYEEYDDEDDAPGTSDFQRRKIFRWLMGLLMLAWSIPFLLNFFQAFGDMLSSIFK